MHFNPEQEKAVCHLHGPMMVLAGPGSGKTAVITGRVCHLIREGADPASLLVVTFTRAAAIEMRARFLKEIRAGSSPVTFGTFHGVFYGILKNASPVRGSQVLSENRKNSVLRELISHAYPAADQEPELPQLTAKEISQVKSGSVELSHFYSGVLPQETFRSVYQSYERWKDENGVLDFDDLIVRCDRLFAERPDILTRWQKKFRYVLVDEFQDISPLQYRIIRKLALPENNLFIVGDDDQSIYRFRGASPELMLKFPQNYPDAVTVTLSENYRSTPQILRAASRVIEKNKRRFPKQLQAVRPDGPEVTVEIFAHPGQEARHLAEELRKRNSEGIPYQEMAVLVRTNLGGRTAMEQLMAWQIPFYAADLMPGLYDHWIAKNVMAYLDIAAGSTKRSDFLQIYNRPNRFFSRDAFLDRQVTFDSLYDYYEDREWMCQRVEQFEADIAMLGRLPLYGAMVYLRKEIGYEAFLREYAAEHRIPSEELLQIYDELTESARNYDSLDAWKSAIVQYNEKRAAQNGERKGKKEGVAVSTLHAAKGMEYKLVYILDVNDGIIPYHKAVLPADREEERRMFYVGMTRAKDELHLYAVRERYEKKMTLSPFLRDLAGK